MERVNADRQLIARLATALAPREEILEAHLFGSHARGRTRRDGDVGVAPGFDTT